MQSSQIPSKFQIPFANGAGAGYIRQIPVASQISITPGAASLTDGFPPLTFIAEGAGGIPPFGQDMNGILNEITAWIQWGNAGAPVVYDATFSAAIGGYPKGTILTSAVGGSWWLSTAENNATDPDTGGAGWLYLSYGLTYAGNPNGNVAGVAATNGALAASLLWDTVHSLLWVCTTTGTSTTAVWITTNPVSESTWCTTSSGTGNAQILSVPFTSFPAGTGLAWTVGASQTNTGATSVTVGTFGSFPVVKDTPTGPAPLVGGELKSGNVVICRYDGTSLHLVNGVNIYANLNGSTAQPFQVAPATSLTEAVQYSQLGNLNGYYGDITASATLSDAAWGQAVQVVAPGITLTLPSGLPSSGLPGGLMHIYGNGGTGTYTIAADANHFIYAPGQGYSSVTTGTTIEVSLDEDIILFSRDTEIDVIGGSWTTTHSLAPTFTSPVTVPDATAPGEAVNLGQANSLYAITVSTSTPVRALATSYTNTSAYKMLLTLCLQVTVRPGMVASPDVMIGGVAYPVGVVENYYGATYESLSVGGTWIVPPGSTYSVPNSSNGVWWIVGWTESIF